LLNTLYGVLMALIVERVVKFNKPPKYLVCVMLVCVNYKSHFEDIASGSIEKRSRLDEHCVNQVT